MDLLFVILRLVFGPDCFPTERLEPVKVRADGCLSSVRTLPAEYLQSRFGMSWPDLRHVCQEPIVDASPSSDAWASPRQCRTCSSQDDAALLVRRNLRS